MIKTAALFLALTCVALLGEGITVYAQTPGGFSVRAVIPDNQVDKKQTYFDLRMNPGDEQDIELVITNSRDEPLEVDVRLNAASTGRNGLIVYSEPDVKDEVMEVAVTDVASPQSQRATIPALGSETVSISIKMPDNAFDGVILGGIAVSEVGGENMEHVAQGVSLKNTITYITALLLTENNNEITPDFELRTVTPSLINYRTAVVVTLRNNVPRIVKGMEIHAQVYRKGSDTVLRELMLTDAEMAPLSIGDFVIDWNNERLASGTYRMKMTAVYNGKTWEWDEEFTIGGEADELNREAKGLTKNDTWMYWLFGIIGLVLVGIIAYLIGKRERKHSE